MQIISGDEKWQQYSAKMDNSLIDLVKDKQPFPIVVALAIFV